MTWYAITKKASPVACVSCYLPHVYVLIGWCPIAERFISLASFVHPCSVSPNMHSVCCCAMWHSPLRRYTTESLWARDRTAIPNGESRWDQMSVDSVICRVAWAVQCAWHCVQLVWHWCAQSNEHVKENKRQTLHSTCRLTKCKVCDIDHITAGALLKKGSSLRINYT